MSGRPGALWPSLLPPDRQGLDELCTVSAHGSRVRFADGRELLDGASGLWNANLGYGNAAIAQASADALAHASYLSVFRYENVYARRAAEALVEVCGPEHYGRVLFSTSGGAANDLVMKLARHFHALDGDPARQLVVGLQGSYHGLTFGSFALTGEDLGQRLYAVDQRLVRHVPPNDVEALTSLMGAQGARIAAVVVEPVLGTGAVPLSDAFVAALAGFREEHGFLLVADEVATGFGRTGTYFASQTWPVQPDVLVASKGLTNGTCAAAAVVVSRRVGDSFAERGATVVHGETQAGTPIACAAITATIAEMRRLDAVASGRRVAARLEEELGELLSTHPRVADLTGTGCFRSVRVVTDDGGPLPAGRVADLVAAIRGAGAIVHPGLHGVQLMPPLTATDAEVTELVSCLRAGLDALFPAPLAASSALRQG